MTASNPPEVPADAVDVTEEVTELKTQLDALFCGVNLGIVAMVIGTALGDTVEDADSLKYVLGAICGMAGRTFAYSQLPQEEDTVH